MKASKTTVSKAILDLIRHLQGLPMYKKHAKVQFGYGSKKKVS